MTPEEANAILAKRFGMQQPVVAQPGMYVRSPQSQSSIFPNSQPQLSKAEQLIKAARERLMNAGGAARMKMREQEEQGVRPYVPADPEAVSAELRRRMGVTQGGQAAVIPRFVNAGSVKTIQQRPTGGVIADYGGGNRVVTSRYGTGSATVGGTGKPATFDGKTKEQFFGQAAARQGADNKYARAEKTGKVDKNTGEPTYTSKAIPKGSDAATERFFEAMKNGSPMPPRQMDEYEARKAAEALWKERTSA